MRRTNVRPTILLGLLAVCLGGSHASVRADVPEPLDWAFRFASAIEIDAKDRARSQDDVIHDLIALGRFDEATALTEKVDGWRQGALFADLAVARARVGDDAIARELIARAEAVRATIRGWQNPRIASHVAEALATIGERQESARLARQLIEHDPNQYSGKAVATVAAALAARGDFDGALTRLDALDGNKDIYVAWWRFVGYVELGRDDRFTDEQRVRALERAESASELLLGWKRAEGLAGAAEVWAGLGKAARARADLRTADEIVSGLTVEPGSATAAMVGAAVGRGWGAIGDRDAAARVLAAAESTIGEMISIEQPAAYAVVAAAYHVAGDETASRRLYDRAFDVADSLVNARPRALAVVEICRTMGRFDVPLPDVDRERLQRLYGGLRAPW